MVQWPLPSRIAVRAYACPWLLSRILLDCLRPASVLGDEGVPKVLIGYSIQSSRGRETPTRESRVMVIEVLYCPHCHSTDIVRHGTTRQGQQRYRCRTCPDHGRTFLLAYAYAGQSPDVKRPIVDMALNASGIRDTARVLHVSPTTVLKELKKKNLTSST
jgi:transposase-like protein